MEATLRKLFNTPSINDLSVDQIEALSEKYPYFAPARYFAAYRLKQDNTADYERQFQKTLLYFQDPLWLEEQLQKLPVSPVVPQQKLLTGVPGTVNVKPETKDEFPIFQAYHTVDYFASQGIRISADMLQTDKFGRQLKSFTEWLRTMKRLPAAKDPNTNESYQDPGVRRFAESSLQEGEILTEAMAEVFAKQGKRQEALGIYSKLSLINPQKSAYFAAKIEALKAV